MPARNPAHQRAIQRVAILSRWRRPDDPELLQARQDLELVRAEVRFNEAATAAAIAATQLRSVAGSSAGQPDPRAGVAER